MTLKRSQAFFQRYWIGLSLASTLLSLLGLGAWGWIIRNRAFLPSGLSPAGGQLLQTYNGWVHGLFIGVIGVSFTLLIGSETWSWRSPIAPTLRAIRRHPLPSALLIAYALAMISESSWFYKEILTWYDDVKNGFLLSNFSLRDSFISESMGRNDFRFFPLAHQDLHLLSWLTPYVKVWSVVSAIELILTVVIAVRLALLLAEKTRSSSLVWIACLLFLFTPAAAYNYFQFIYSERLLTLLLALYAYFYGRYLRCRDRHDATLALTAALLGSFTKDTAILLFVIPAVTTVLAGSLGGLPESPRWSRHAWRTWLETYQFEAMLIGLIPLWCAAVLGLSVLPSVFFGDARYDAGLRFSALELDLRTAFLTAFLIGRAVFIARHKARFQLLDGLNIAAIAYSLALFALVGFKSTNYMALPVHWIALLDLLFLWSAWLEPRLQRRWSWPAINLLAIGLSSLVLIVEHRFAQTFVSRWTDIHQTQRSWQATLDRADAFAREARRKGEPVNLIFSKSWFKHSDTIRRQPFDRLVYLDPDKQQYRILEGRQRGQLYQPGPGDFFLDIGSGKKLEKYGVDISSFEPIYRFDPAVSNGRIYRWPAAKPE